MDVGWQRQDSLVTSPCTEKKKDALIRTFWQTPWHMGISPLQVDVDLVDQDATRAGWTISRAFGNMLGLIGTCDRLLEPQEGQRFAYWMVIMPWRGQRVP